MKRFGEGFLMGEGFDSDGVGVSMHSGQYGVVGVRILLDKKFSGEEIEIALNAKAKTLIKEVEMEGVILSDFARWRWMFTGRSVLQDIKPTLEEFAKFAREYIAKKRSQG